MTAALTTSALVTLFALITLRPRLPRRSSLFNMQFALGYTGWPPTAGSA